MVAACQSIASFIGSEVQKQIDEARKGGVSSEAVSAIAVMLSRTKAWLGSVDRLRHPSDFQAIQTGTRFMFEVAVDMTLLHYDRAGHPIEKMLAWGESAKLKNSEAAKEFVDQQPKGAPLLPGVQPRLDFLRDQASNVEGLRKKFWPSDSNKKIKHPTRWTGSRNLRVDATDADQLRNGSFLQFYLLTYPHNCWHVHAGIVGAANMDIDDLAGIVTVAYRPLINYSLLVVELSLRYLNRWTPDLETRFEAFTSAVEKEIVDGFIEHPDRATDYPAP